MPINSDSLNKNLFDLLKTKGYNPVPLDSKGERTPAPEEADVFKSTFKVNNKPYGDLWTTVDDAQNLVVYYSDDVTDSPADGEDTLGYDESWSGLLRHLKSWALRRQLSFELRNKDHLSTDMAQRGYMKTKENLAEGYYPMGKSSSYTNDIPSIKIILQHTRQIQEGEQRFRNIAKIFLENTEGERILAPTTRPGLARIYARHLAEGGVPNDERWNHIKGLCEEYGKMAGFVRATKNKTFNESATGLIQEGLNHYNNLRETLGKLTGHRGYTNYFESWTPALMEDESEESTVNELFVQETLDPRIESVMPILNKLQKKINEMSEVNELESWADNIIENSLSEGHKVNEEEVEESGLQAYLGKKKYGEEGMKALQKAGRDGVSKEKMASIRAKYDKLDEEEVDETKKKSSFEKFRDSVKKKTGYDMDKGSRNIDDIIKRLKELEKEYNSDKKVNEAPGAETLAHNDETEQSNLKAFDLAEGVRSSHEDPLVAVYDKDGLHTHANLSTVNHIFNINVDAEDVHKGPVITKSGWEDGRKLKIKLSKHHKADDAFGSSPADRLSVREQGVAEGKAEHAWNAGISDEDFIKKYGKSEFDRLTKKYGISSIPVPNLIGYRAKEPTDPEIRSHRGLDGLGAQLKSIIKKQGVAEGVMSEIAIELGEIADREDFDALYDLMTSTSPAGKMVQKIANDIAINHQLRDDDHEELERRVMDYLVDEFGSEMDISEGEFAGNFKTGPAGQWRNKGPKAHKPATVGDLVGASESIDRDPLDEIKRLMGK